MNLFRLDKVGMVKNNAHRVKTDKKLHGGLRQRTANSTLVQLGNPDLRATGVYHPSTMKRKGNLHPELLRNTTAETLRSIVERMTYKQASSSTKTDEEYWSAEATSQRVIELVKTLAADDPERFQQMKLGFIKGFNDAQALYGGKLPEVCRKTFNLAIEVFDSWMANKDNP